MSPPVSGRRGFLRRLFGAGLLLGSWPAASRASPWSPGAPGWRLPRVVVPHPSGAAVEVFLQGAHVASWTRPGGEEMLFTSRRSRFEPGAPIRGGIPVVFPQFASLGPLPSHGLVRTLPWQVTYSGADAEGAGQLRLQRCDDEATRALWPHSFRTELLVSVADALSVTLTVTNTGQDPFAFQSALHTYHRVGDVRRVRLMGLDGVGFVDRTAGGAERRGYRGPLRIERQTDRIYTRAPDRLRIHDPDLGRSVIIEKRGFADAVVWNPWVEGARRAADLGDDEYTAMLCVEPANIVEPTRLVPGATWSGTQTLRVE